MFKLFSQTIMKMEFDQAKRLQLYRILSKATDEKRRGVKVLSVLSSLMKQEKRSSTMYKLYALWSKQIANGLRFSEAIQGFVPPAAAMLISANESAGSISDGFKMALELAKQKKSLYENYT